MPGPRLSRLADDFALHPEPAAPAELVTVAAGSAKGRFAARGVHLVVDADGGLPDVVVDRDRVGQVLGNLLDNALLHTPAGGTARADAARTDRGGLRVTVADTGDGIDAAHLPHVFERFYWVDTARDRQHGGFGIGLAIAKALVEAHGGTISAHSDGADRGATFVVVLPERGPAA